MVNNDDNYNYDDPVVLWDEETGAVTDSELRQICEQITELKLISAWGIIKNDADSLKTVFQDGRIPIVSPYPCQPHQAAPLCYLVDSSLLSERQILILGIWLHENFPSLLTETAAIAYVRDGLPLQTTWFTDAIVYQSVMPSDYPNNAPLYWRNETSGRLSKAIHQYSACTVYDQDKQEDRQNFDPGYISLIRGYFFHWINAPGWSDSQELTQLRKEVRCIHSIDDIDRFLDNALKVGIDPL
jgi:hypothetical protein